MSDTNYIAINTSPTSQAVIDQVVEVDMNDPVIEVIDTVAPAAVQETVEAPVVKPQEPRKSRAQERIKDLVAKGHEKDFLLDKARQDMSELQKQLLAGHTATKENLKTTLESQVTSLNSQMVSAMQAGDSTEVVKLQDLMISAKMELKGLSTELKDSYKAVEQAKAESPQVQQKQNVPEKALEWIDVHPEFKTDELFYNSSLVVNNQLLREGFDANSDEFYEELDQRLSKRFPEVFGVQQENGVSYTNKTDSPNPTRGVKAGVPVSRDTSRVTEQVVSGSARPSSNVIQKGQKTQVTLTPADVRQAEAWGLDLKQMARRIAHKENNSRGDGYVSIAIPKS
jgi:hypothetical protein